MSASDRALSDLLDRVEGLASVNVEGGTDAWMRAVDEACAGLSEREARRVLVRVLGVVQESFMTLTALTHDLPGFRERTSLPDDAKQAALRDFRFKLAVADLGDDPT